MSNYCNGSIKQVRNRVENKHPTLEEMFALRKESSGVLPLFALAEYVEHPLLHLCPPFFSSVVNYTD